MANSAAQLIGYVLALISVCLTISATLMVEWKREVPKGDGSSGKEEYWGLWSTCSVERSGGYFCKPHKLFINLSARVQAARAVMLLSALFSICGTLVATVGLKCTTCLNGNTQAKNRVATVGGIFVMIAGVLALSSTSWFAYDIVQSVGEDNQYKHEFGRALFVSWGGAILSLVGGAFLGCRCPTQSMRSSMRASIKLPKRRPGTESMGSSIQLSKHQPASDAGTDYV